MIKFPGKTGRKRLRRALGVDSVSVESSGGVSVSAAGALAGVSGGTASMMGRIYIDIDMTHMPCLECWSFYI
jgi:hypothetical protein